MYFLKKGSGSGAQEARRAATAVKPAAVVRRNPAVVAKPPAMPDLDTPAKADERMDGDVQAGALLAASMAGVPFCAECEKARRMS